MYALDKRAKVSTVTSSCDLWLRCQRSKKVKFQMANGKTIGANMLALGKHSDVSTVTSSSDLWLGVKRLKEGHGVKGQSR